jgi:hypothetical protein
MPSDFSTNVHAGLTTVLNCVLLTTSMMFDAAHVLMHVHRHMQLSTSLPNHPTVFQQHVLRSGRLGH